MTSKGDILRWLQDAKREGATHVIVVCDTFDHEDYPVQVKPGEDVRKKYEQYNGPNMQQVMEVYALHLDWESQLNEHRSFHFETASPAEPTPKRTPKRSARRLH
jgi:hypothetical protein